MSTPLLIEEEFKATLRKTEVRRFYELVFLSLKESGLRVTGLEVLPAECQEQVLFKVAGERWQLDWFIGYISCAIAGEENMQVLLRDGRGRQPKPSWPLKF